MSMMRLKSPALWLFTKKTSKLGMGAIRQQEITWANVDSDLCHHMPSLGHNVLIEGVQQGQGFTCHQNNFKILWLGTRLQMIYVVHNCTFFVASFIYNLLPK